MMASASKGLSSLSSPSSSSSSSSSSAVMSEIVLKCSDGIRIAAQSWTSGKVAKDDELNPPQKEHRVLALHGWMDNCRTFHHLAPTLVDHYDSTNKKCRVVAMDFPGHGMSSHRSIDAAPTVMAESVFYVAEAVRELKWNQKQTSTSENDSNNDDNNNNDSNNPQFTLVGHSMGAAVGLLYAAAFPQEISQLVLLEGAGPLARPTCDVAQHIRRHVLQRQRGLASGGMPPRKVYPSLEKAIQARCLTARNSPGNQYLSIEAGREIVSRGTEPAMISGGDDDPAGAGAVQFRHDPRLQLPSILYFSVEQNNAIYRNIKCPTAVITATNGWPFDEQIIGRVLELLKPAVRKTLPGSHHFHADPDTAPLVSQEVIQFLERQANSLL